MSLPTLFLVSLGLSMDAFAAAIVAGVAAGRPTFLMGLKISAPFGAFALLFAMLGWGLGFTFREIVTDWDHWIAFGLLAIVGVGMIVGAVTFAAAAVGVHLGRVFGPHLGKKAEIVGGLVLIALGVKILLEDILVG